MAGRARLVVTGIQDQWLTGEPQFSYFVMNYKRHSRFAIEAVERPFDGQVGFGQTVTCRIPDNVGDLLRSVTLKVTLDPLALEDSGGPQLFSLPSGETVRLYNTSIGTRIIEYADLIIGGQMVERLTGEYVYTYDQLHHNKDDTEQTLYFTSGHGSHIAFDDPYTFYVNLPFYFYRHPSLAVPICAITKQLVEVRITFKPVDYKIAYSYLNLSDRYTVRPITNGRISAASVLADFFFITDDEKNFMRTRPMEYLITQVQLATVPIAPTVTERSVLLTFQHPVKELVFVATLSERDVDRRYPSTGIIAEADRTITMSPDVPLRSDHVRIKRAALAFNGEEVFDRSGTYLAYEQSLRHHTGCPSPAYEFYTYSFALEPEVYSPTGQVNMSRIIHKQLTVELEESDAFNETVVSVYAINYNVLRVDSGLAGLKF
jgi:hypothetical protein